MGVPVVSSNIVGIIEDQFDNATQFERFISYFYE